MPKEIFHVAVARKVFGEKLPHSFYLATTVPDMFFYQPFPLFQRAGSLLHRLEGCAFDLTRYFHELPQFLGYVVEGMLFHLCTDALWHRHIEAASRYLAVQSYGSLDRLPYRLRLVFWHRYLESVIQSFFLEQEDVQSICTWLNKCNIDEIFCKDVTSILYVLTGLKISHASLYWGIKLHKHVLLIIHRLPHIRPEKSHLLPAYLLPLVALVPPDSKEAKRFVKTTSHASLALLFQQDFYHATVKHLRSLFSYIHSEPPALSHQYLSPAT